MRELVLKRYCDVCRITTQDEDLKVPATTCFSVGIVEGESRPVPKVVDVCADHVAPLADLLALLADVHQLPGDVPKVAKAKSKAAPAAKVAAMRAPLDASGHSERQCPICHQWSNTAGLTGHIWKSHRQDKKPPMPPTCPECGEAYNGSGMSSHRRLSHGFDSVADALSGVPGYRQPKALPSSEQMELTGT